MTSSIIANNTYSYIDEKNVPSVLKCKLCTKPFVDPVTTSNNDTFCRGCITNILSRRSNGGLAEIESLRPVTEPLVFAMLDALLVRCTKCGEPNITRGKLEEHENTACMQATVSCHAADLKCPWVGPRDEIDDHLEHCKFEPLRSALGSMFADHDQVKSRLENLEREIEDLVSSRMVNQLEIH